MKFAITGSSGHLGEALARKYLSQGDEVVGIDILPSEFTTILGSITDSDLVLKALSGVEAVIHTATLHKPHVASHTKSQFVDVNIHGTQNLLDAARQNDAKAFVFTSTTSTFGNAMSPKGASNAVWVTENLRPIPKNIYGVTKLAAEDLCQLAFQEHGLPCLVLKTSRFFPEEDDMKHTMPGIAQDNIKTIEFLNRRADIEDIVMAHQLAIKKAATLGFEKFIITATTPFSRSDCHDLLCDAPAVLERYHPEYVETFANRGWQMFAQIGRVYDNQRAREKLGWDPINNFSSVLKRLQSGGLPLSHLAYQIGTKGYHRGEQNL